jgi:SAM-dependent methyltransferase
MITRIEIGGNEGVREGFIQVDRYGKPDIRADIRALPFRNLEKIYASHVLEHVPDADVVLALTSCRRALRPEGILEVYVPDLPWMMRRFLRAGSQGEKWSLWLRWLYGSQEHEGQYHRTGFSVKRLVDCLIAAGFRSVTAKRMKRKEHFGHVEVHALAAS